MKLFTSNFTNQLLSWELAKDLTTHLTVNRLLGSTSIIPRNKFWQSGGTKWGMWNTPRLTFSSNCRKLSSSNGKAPWKYNIIMIYLWPNYAVRCWKSLSSLAQVMLIALSHYLGQNCVIHHSKGLHIFFGIVSVHIHECPHRINVCTFKLSALSQWISVILQYFYIQAPKKFAKYQPIYAIENHVMLSIFALSISLTMTINLFLMLRRML